MTLDEVNTLINAFGGASEVYARCPCMRHAKAVEQAREELLAGIAEYAQHVQSEIRT